MFKFFVPECHRRVGRSLLLNHCAEVKKTGSLVRLFTSYNANMNLYSACAQTSFHLRYNTMAHHAQHAWKKISRHYRRSAFIPITMIVCATGIALTMSSSAASWIYPCFSRELAAMRNEREASQWVSLPKASSIHTLAQAGQAYFKSLFFSVLDHLVLCMRAIYLGILFSPTMAMSPFADSFGVQFREKWIHLVRVSLEKAGPAFVVLGQWVATRPDLFPRDLCMELSSLHNKASEHSFDYTKRTTEKAFGGKITEFFDDFEEGPVETGSTAQVHRATLRCRYPGKESKPMLVSVKVRHPGIEETFKKDYVIIQAFANMLNLIPKLKWLMLDTRLQHFGDLMASKADLYKEASLFARFSYNFHGEELVTFPKPLFPFVHPAVSVAAYEEGSSVSPYIDGSIKLKGDIKDDIIAGGTCAVVNMIMADRFVHDGTHPKNVRVHLEEGTNRLIFLDVGLTATISESEQRNLKNLIHAVGIRDGLTAATCALRLSDKQNCPCPNSFIEDVDESFAFWDTREGGMISPLECMSRLLDKVRCHKVTIDDNVCTAMASIMALEGWQRKLYLESRYRVMQTFHCFSNEERGFYEIYHPMWRSERGKMSKNILD